MFASPFYLWYTNMYIETGDEIMGYGKISAKQKQILDFIKKEILENILF